MVEPLVCNTFLCCENLFTKILMTLSLNLVSVGIYSGIGGASQDAQKNKSHSGKLLLQTVCLGNLVSLLFCIFCSYFKILCTEKTLIVNYIHS